jgi:hypothetical protein
MGGVHVSASPLEVARIVRSKTPSLKGSRLDLRIKRRYVIACALNAHAENRRVFCEVVNRRKSPLEWGYLFNPKGKRPKTTVKIPKHDRSGVKN